MCKVPTGRALCARIANTLLIATVLSAAYAVERGHDGSAAHAHPGVALEPAPRVDRLWRPTPEDRSAMVQLGLAAATCRRPAGPSAGRGYEGSSSIGAPAGPLPSWWSITLPPWPTRT